MLGRAPPFRPATCRWVRATRRGGAIEGARRETRIGPCACPALRRGAKSHRGRASTAGEGRCPARAGPPIPRRERRAPSVKNPWPRLPIRRTLHDRRLQIGLEIPAIRAEIEVLHADEQGQVDLAAGGGVAIGRQRDDGGAEWVRDHRLPRFIAPLDGLPGRRRRPGIPRDGAHLRRGGRRVTFSLCHLLSGSSGA